MEPPIIKKNETQSIVPCQTTALEVIYKSLVWAIFIYAIYIRLSLPLVPFTGPDSIGYLGFAFNYINTGIFTGIAERPFPSPGFLTILINLTGDASYISLIQHALGVTGGALFLKATNLSLSYLPKQAYGWSFIYKFINLTALFLILNSSWQVSIEHWTAPEALTMPLMMGYFYCSLKLYGSMRQQKPFWIDFAWSTIFSVFSFLMFLFQPRFALGFLAAAVFYYISRFVLPGGILRKATLIAIPTALAVLSAKIPLVSNFPYKPAVECNRSGGLFYYNLKTIIPLIEADILDSEFSSFNKSILRQIASDFKAAQAFENASFSTGYFSTIGYNSDYLMKTYNFVLSKNNGDFIEATKLYQHYLKKALTVNPAGLASKVYAQLAHYYSNTIVFQDSQILHYNKNWAYSFETVKTWKSIFSNKSGSYDLYVNNLDFVSRIKSNYSLPASGLVNGLFRFLNKCYLAHSAFFLFVLIFSITIKSRYCAAGLFALCIMAFDFFVNLTISIGATTEVPRYIFDQHSWHIAFLALSLTFTVSVLWTDLIKGYR